MTCNVEMTMLDDGLTVVRTPAYNAFLRRLKEGQLVSAQLSDERESDPQRRSRLFHALMRAYGAHEGTAAPSVKVLLKYMYGVWEPVVRGQLPPKWPAMRWVRLPPEYPDSYIWLKSVTCYTKAEWYNLIQGTILACTESGADIEEIMTGAEAAWLARQGRGGCLAQTRDQNRP